MDLSIEDTREDIRATRGEMADTAEALSDRVHERIATVKRKVNPLEYAREYPWAALAIATGIGLGISLTRADRKAARASVRGAKSAGGAIASGAAELKDRAVELVQHHDDSDQPTNENAAAGQSSGGGIRDRIQASVHGLLSHGLDELMREIRR